MKSKIKIFIMLIFLAMTLAGCKSRSVGSVSGTGFYFDTIISVTVYGTDDQTIVNELMDECRRYEKIFSPTMTDSELYKLNHAVPEGTAAMWPVSEDLYNCIEKAYKFSKLTDGRYDITVRPVSELWDFKSEDPVVPDESLISEKLKYVDYRNIIPRGKWEDWEQMNGSEGEQDNTSGKDNTVYEYRVDITGGTMIDLGSVAKGYIGDKLCEYLKDKGYDSAIISLGGNVQCLGGKLNENGEFENFRVAVKSPFPESGTDGSSEPYADVLSVKDVAVVTSGIYERCFEKEGKLYHHILDAGTGYPADNDLASVTIVAESGFDADILSTVCFLAGYEETVDRLKKAGETGNFEAEFIYKDGTVRKTEGFDKFF